jgi:hypothetical protein
VAELALHRVDRAGQAGRISGLVAEQDTEQEAGVELVAVVRARLTAEPV